MSREDAKIIVNKFGGKFPSIYLGVKLEEILDEINLSLEDFIKICDKFTNKNLFKCNNRNELIKDEHSNLFINNIN